MAIKFIAVDDNGKEVTKETLLAEFRRINGERETLGKERIKLKEQLDAIDAKMKRRETELVNVSSILVKFGIHLDIARKNVGKATSDITL